MKQTRLHNIEFMKEHQGFIKRMNDEGRSKSGKTSLENLSKEFLSYMETIGVSSIKRIGQHEINQFFDYLKQRPNRRKSGGLSATYINKYREAVLRFMEYYHRCTIGNGPFEIECMDPEERDNVEVLSEDEIQALYDTCDNSFIGISNRLIISLLYGAGLRAGELHNLEIDDFDLRNGFIRLSNTKTKYERDVPMFEKVQHHLEDYLYNARNMMLGTNSTETHLLVTQRGLRMCKGTITFRLNRMAEQAGIERSVHPHLLRHTIATHLLDLISLQDIADFLGHRCLDSTQIYTRIKAGIL